MRFDYNDTTARERCTCNSLKKRLIKNLTRNRRCLKIEFQSILGIECYNNREIECTANFFLILL